ncbi:MAG: hypothetical protein OXI53_07820 [Nitrospira sp.]|nr:hypothetical protein [Nitrospira sp.]MDE0485835.1 hypothetical protein [Nitrospira sp.]
MLAFGSRGLRARGKVKSRRFFPPFCRVLGQCGIASVYIGDYESLERELCLANNLPLVLVNLVNEDRDDIKPYRFPNDLLRNVTAVFNPHNIAGLVRDKKEANQFFFKHNISVPDHSPDERTNVFSNSRFGTGARAFIIDNFQELDGERYNTQFIDTTVRFKESVYFTCIRLMCIGTYLIRIYIRARDVSENNPSVHSKNTPKDPELLDCLHEKLVATRLEAFRALSARLGHLLGPGFYAHDVLIENKTGQLFLCETGFKFYDDTYEERMSGVVSDRNFLSNISDQETYAGHAASVFVSYCAEKGFF